MTSIARTSASPSKPDREQRRFGDVPVDQFLASLGVVGIAWAVAVALVAFKVWRNCRRDDQGGVYAGTARLDGEDGLDRNTLNRNALDKTGLDGNTLNRSALDEEGGLWRRRKAWSSRDEEAVLANGRCRALLRQTLALRFMFMRYREEACSNEASGEL
jgi:hypothetical protein